MPPREHQIIQSRVRIPRTSDGVAPRPRVEERLVTLLERQRVVVVSASAGAGKTTAVATAVQRTGSPVAWLTVDFADRAPGHLVTYLERAVASQQPAAKDVATRALASGLTHPEAAGLLAEAIGEQRLILVLDELERLEDEPEPWAIIEAMVRFTAVPVRIILVSRRQIPLELRTITAEPITASLGDAELAFTPVEASEALAKAGEHGVNPDQAVAATGGWVMGVLFESYRAAEHVRGTGGEADPLYGYLSSQILAALTPEDREFLVGTSVFGEVTAQRGAALGERFSALRLRSLQAARLPVVWEPDRLSFRCHSRFREYLLAQLDQRDIDVSRRIHRLCGRRLAQEKLYEESTEELLRAEAPEEAIISAERAIIAVIERLDLDVADRWLNALEEAIEASPSGRITSLITARLMLDVTKQDFRRGIQLADWLEGRGELLSLARDHNHAAALIAWCYLSDGRLDDMEKVLAAAGRGPATDAVRYSATLWRNAGETSPATPSLTGGPLDALVLVTHHLRGALRMAQTTAESQWAARYAQPWQVATARALGSTRTALELYSALQGRDRDPGAKLALALAGADLFIDLEDAEAARGAIQRGRKTVLEAGSFGYEMLLTLADAKLALRVEHDDERALALLRSVEEQLAEHPLVNAREACDTWFGLALLHAGRDQEARLRLQGALASMVDGHRYRDRPTAAVYLSEAEWRADNEDAADRAADLAIDAARYQGSNHILLQALSEFPAVLYRRLDSEQNPRSEWHALARALVLQNKRMRPPLAVGLTIELRDFGTPQLIVDGSAARPRIGKSYLLLAVLAHARRRRISREELLSTMFGDHAGDEASRVYLRQAIHQLKSVLPENTLSSEQGNVELAESVLVTSDSELFELRLAEAVRQQGASRIAATQDAIALFDQGEFLQGIESDWVDTRRRELSELAVDARLDLADLAYAAGDLVAAERYVDAVLGVDLYREAAWRLRMQIAHGLGDEDGVVRAFSGCSEALAELHAEPSAATRKLLAALRG